MVGLTALATTACGPKRFARDTDGWEINQVDLGKAVLEFRAPAGFCPGSPLRSRIDVHRRFVQSGSDREVILQCTLDYQSNPWREDRGRIDIEVLARVSDRLLRDVGELELALRAEQHARVDAQGPDYEPLADPMASSFKRTRRGDHDWLDAARYSWGLRHYVLIDGYIYLDIRVRGFGLGNRDRDARRTIDAIRDSLRLLVPPSNA